MQAMDRVKVDTQGGGQTQSPLEERSHLTPCLLLTCSRSRMAASSITKSFRNIPRYGTRPWKEGEVAQPLASMFLHPPPPQSTWLNWQVPSTFPARSHRWALLRCPLLLLALGRISTGFLGAEKKERAKEKEEARTPTRLHPDSCMSGQGLGRSALSRRAKC